MENKNNRMEFIEMVLTCAEENLPLDNSIMISELLHRTDDILDELECLDERLEIIEKKINFIYTKLK